MCGAGLGGAHDPAATMGGMTRPPIMGGKSAMPEAPA